MKKTIYFATILAVLALCQKPDVAIPVAPVDENLKMNLLVDFATKVTDTAFESGDVVGVYLVNYVDGSAE